MCTHSPGSQFYSGLHQEKGGQQVKGGQPRPHEIPPVVLFPHVESSASLQHGTVGLDPEEKWSTKMVHKSGQSGTCPLRRQAERLGVVQPGEVKDPGRC